MTCEKCDTAGSILRRSWDAKGGLCWLCAGCWAPKPASVPAVRVRQCRKGKEDIVETERLNAVQREHDAAESAQRAEWVSQIPCDFYPANPRKCPSIALGGDLRAVGVKSRQGGVSDEK